MSAAAADDLTTTAYQATAQASAGTVQQLATIWAAFDPVSPEASWVAMREQVARIISGGQLTAAQITSGYLAAYLRTVGLTTPPDWLLQLARWAGWTSAGEPLLAVLDAIPATVGSQVAAGTHPADAARAAWNSLAMLAGTEVTDAGRSVHAAAAGSDNRITGYVRVVHLPACSRCIILAGREYPWNAAFKRHPRCDCGQKPLIRDKPSPAHADPGELFASMTPDQQDAMFGIGGASAIRDGADIAQVVNADRGMRALGDSWTTEGTTVRGIAGKRLGRSGATPGSVKITGSRYQVARTARMTPGALLQQYGHDRDRYIAALWRNGYIVPRTPDVEQAFRRLDIPGTPATGAA